MAVRKRSLKHRIVRSGHNLLKTVGTIAETAILGLQEEDLEGDGTDLLSLTETLLLRNAPPAALKVNRQNLQEERRQPIPAVMKSAMMERDRHRCVHCGATQSLELHHYVQVAYGGKNFTGNLVTLCATCHSALHIDHIKIRKPKSVPIEE